MLSTYSFLNIFTLLNRRSETEAKTRKLTFCLQEVIWEEVNYKQVAKMTICSFGNPIFNTKRGRLYIY